MRKSFLTFLIICFMFTLFYPLHLEAAQFNDINNHWAKTYIETLNSAGHIKGYNDNTFRADNPITRAEFITVLNSCMGATPSSATSDSFSDTTNHWGRNQINKAVENGVLVVSEYPNGLEPNGYIKRSEVAAMLIRALGEKPDMGTTPPFSDINDVQKSMYKDYIKKAFDLKLLSGFPGGSFQPFSDMTRGQVAKVLTDFKLLENNSSVLPGTFFTNNVSTIIIDNNSYNTNQISLAFKFGYTIIPVTTINASSDRIIINNSNQFMLNNLSNNPAIIINNILYEVDKYSHNNNQLIVSSTARKINTIYAENYKYNADYVKLYINSQYGDNYLSDMAIIDQSTVKLNTKTYDLTRDRLTITLGKKFYDIIKINLNNSDNPLSLSETDRVIADGMSISDISAIFSGSSTLNLNTIKKLEILINNQLYSLSEVIIDGSSNFTVNRKSYTYQEVLLSIDGHRYTINKLTMYKDKFIFYCTETDFSELILINSTYRNPEDLILIKGATSYDFENVLVISRNVIRIEGKQYTVDSSYMIRMDNQIYEITRIDYNNTLDVVEITAKQILDSGLNYQPDKFVFYVNDEKYQDGINSDTTIYVDGNWITFSKILILDPSSFNYRNENYNLIGADVKLSQLRLEIVDTTWSGRTGILKIYLE